MVAGIGPFVIAGLLFGLLYNTLFYPRTLVEYVEAGTIGLILGAAVGLVEELTRLPAWLQRRSIAAAIAVRTLLYSTAVAVWSRYAGGRGQWSCTGFAIRGGARPWIPSALPWCPQSERERGDDLPMIRASCVPLVPASLLVGSIAAAAQAAPEPPDGDIRPIFGVAVGAESVPHVVDPVCGRLDARHVSGSLSGYVAVPLGPLALQGGATLHPRGEINCPSLQVVRNGLVTTRSTDIPGGDFVSLDLRLRLPGSATRWWRATLGGGWAASGKGIPYVVGSVGALVRRSVAVGVELETRSYRVPSVFRTAEYDHGELVGLLSDQRRVDWEHATALRFVLEIPTGRDR